MNDPRMQLVQSFLGNKGADPLQFALQARALGLGIRGQQQQAGPAPAGGGGGKLVAVGDSLGVGTTPYLHAAAQDTKVGRSSASAVEALKRIGGGADRILFDAGTNDGTAAQLAKSIKRALKVAGGATVYVPTVNGPQAAAKNAVIRRMGEQGLIQVVDWAGASRGLVGGDGIHASPQGYRRRAQMIRDAMA